MTTGKTTPTLTAIIISGILATVAILCGIALGMYGIFVIPAFSAVFESFGIDGSLPASTAFLTGFRYILWMPLILTVVTSLLLKSNSMRIVGYSVFILMDFILFLLVVASMNLPLNNLWITDSIV